jgi:hypothetical protein
MGMGGNNSHSPQSAEKTRAVLAFVRNVVCPRGLPARPLNEALAELLSDPTIKGAFVSTNGDYGPYAACSLSWNKRESPLVAELFRWTFTSSDPHACLAFLDHAPSTPP